jgi:glyoxylase-like metal-dependent hydrolase (beta-lactamase superfamily II)
MRSMMSIRFLTTAAAIAAACYAAVTPQATSAQASPAPAVGLLHVQRAVHMLVGQAGNSAVQIGDDGVLVVDAQPAGAVPAMVSAIRTLSPRPIHTIINTHLHDDRAGGDDALVKLRGTGATQAVRVMAHEAVLDRMVKASTDAGRPVSGLTLNAVISLPINNTYTSPGRDFYLNGESVFLYHAPAAHTDGDTIVHFRGSDVLAVGDLFRPDVYPVIDLRNGGSVDGLIAALNRILDLTVPARFQEGGTYVIPGHGRLCDEADVVEYRDMVTIVRDRVRDLIRKGTTLAQVKAARPSSDYDPEYGGPAGPSSPDAFVESIYRSLGGK